MVRVISPRPQLRQFGKDQRGSLTVLTLCLFFLMLIMAGIAIDVMRYETTRTALQNTLDRCTLMAAALDQRLDATAVVTDCVTKAGMAEELQDVQVVAGMNLRDVTSTGRADTNPMFMHLIGIDEMDAVARSGAVQQITNVEIALVLDVSGSMSGAKIANLKEAASEFVDNMLANDPNNRVSITVVPYNAQVNLGPALRSKYQATNLHNVADVNCLELPASVFASAAIPRNVDLPMSAYADFFYATNTANAYLSPTDATQAMPNATPSFCRRAPENNVRLPSRDPVTLKARINAMQAGGNTSITLGMKWGLSLLDPSARPMFNELIVDGAMAATMAGRPFDYTDNDAMKVIVLMTDGEHVQHNIVRDAYKSGPSNIWRSTGDGRYSVFHATRPGANKYWLPHNATWIAAPYNSGAGAVQQDWTAIWANLKMSYVAWQFNARALGTTSSTRNTAYNTAMSAMLTTYAPVANMNTTLQTSCAQAKANDVLVYGIAFEAPLNGQTQISQCATSPSHYFDANGRDEIREAFRMIASNLTQLKLTQ
jgi:Flp pilus assembly protein TadG